MTTNANILAKAAEVADLARIKYREELLPPPDMYLPPPVQPGQSAPIIVPVLPFEEIEALVGALAALIVEEFEWFTEPDPDRVTQMLDSLRHIVGSFENPFQDPTMGYMDQVHANTDEWYGLAADAFNLNFLNPFQAQRHNQVAFVAELATVLQGYQTMLLESRRKILEIGDATIAALNTVRAGGGAPAPVIISIVSAVVGVLAAAYSGGASLTIPFAVLGGGLGIATEAVDSGLIQGVTVASVIDSMTQTITMVKNDMIDAENLLITALTHDAQLLADARALAAQRQRNDLVPIRPNVTEVLSGTDVDFEHAGGSGS